MVNRHIYIRSAVVCLFFVFTRVPIDAQEWSASRPDGHAPIGVMGDHTHEGGEMMLSYRFMRMQMEGTHIGSDRIPPSDVLADFMVAPLRMSMSMHMIGVMLAPSDRALRGQRLAVELASPIWQDLDGPQLESDWSLVAGWQYAFEL